MFFPKEFNEAVKVTLGFEGGTNHDPVDRGGVTKFGISHKQYPQVTDYDFSLDDAKRIYFFDYWKHNKCHNLPTLLALVLFDTSVNCGQKSAVKWLQQSYNESGEGVLLVDGKIGPLTLGAINQVNTYRLLHGLLGYRMLRYVSLIDSHPKQIKYIKGWSRRCIKLQMLILKGSPTL